MLRGIQRPAHSGDVAVTPVAVSFMAGEHTLDLMALVGPENLPRNGRRAHALAPFDIENSTSCRDAAPYRPKDG